jgi:hypothetical protein
MSALCRRCGVSKMSGRHVVIARTLLMRCSLLSETKPSPGRPTICGGLLIAHTTSGRRRSSYSQSASNANCAPAGGAADLAFGGSGHTDTFNSCPTHSASDGDLRGHAIRLKKKRRGRYGLRRCCDGYGKGSNCDQPDHKFSPMLY